MNARFRTSASAREFDFAAPPKRLSQQAPPLRGFFYSEVKDCFQKHQNVMPTALRNDYPTQKGQLGCDHEATF